MAHHALLDTAVGGFLGYEGSGMLGMSPGQGALAGAGAGFGYAEDGLLGAGVGGFLGYELGGGGYGMGMGGMGMGYGYW